MHELWTRDEVFSDYSPTQKLSQTTMRIVSSFIVHGIVCIVKSKICQYLELNETATQFIPVLYIAQRFSMYIFKHTVKQIIQHKSFQKQF